MQTSATNSEKKVISIINTNNNDGNSFMSSSQVAAVGTSYCLNAILCFECNSAGTFKLQWGAAVTGGTVKLNGGTVMIATQLN